MILLNKFVPLKFIFDENYLHFEYGTKVNYEILDRSDNIMRMLNYKLYSFRNEYYIKKKNVHFMFHMSTSNNKLPSIFSGDTSSYKYTLYDSYKKIGTEYLNLAKISINRVKNKHHEYNWDTTHINYIHLMNFETVGYMTPKDYITRYTMVYNSRSTNK